MALPERDLVTYLACLGLGTLRAIRAGVLHPDVGIWTLAVPGFSDPLAHKCSVPREMVEVFKAADELAAIQKLCGQEAFETALDALIAALERNLAQCPNAAWRLRWIEDGRPLGDGW